MKPIHDILLLTAALVLAASCINPRPEPPLQSTSSHGITAEQFNYGGHRWIAFFCHFDTRQLFDVKHDPDCPSQGTPAGRKRRA